MNYSSDFKDNPKLRKIYLSIMDNAKAQFEKTGKFNNKKYYNWNEASKAVHYAANKIIAQRYPEYFKGKSKYMSKDNKQLADELDYYYQKTKQDNLLKSFNHPDYKHVHENIDIE